MVDDEGLFREKIRNSFSNVKNDISNLGISLNKLEDETRFNETNYSQIANRLNLTETTVRGTVNRLISKKLPVSKERLFNGKTSLSLKKDFHDLNLLGKLVRLRQNPLDQQTLF